MPPATYSYDANDRLLSDTYDANGSNTASGGNTYSYDFEKRLTSSNGAVTIVYDGDGNRVAKTASGVTTYYLVDDRNLTGYAQVLEEVSGGFVQRVYGYGLNRISQTQASGTSFYGYDGHGSVRILTDASGAVTDRYDYDAYGNRISLSGSTPNLYLYSGEQIDTNVGSYYLRARYYGTDIGRFTTADPFDGATSDPVELHRYLYGADDPVNKVDLTGKWATFIHKKAIDDVLAYVPVALEHSDLQILKHQQDAVDRDQAAADSYRHAMRNGPSQSPAEAQLVANSYVWDLLTKARTAQDHTKAMEDLGQAMHALQDSTSPAHHGFQPWQDYCGGDANPHEWYHGGRELINPGQGSALYWATGKAYEYFHDTRMPLPADSFNDLGVDGSLIGSELRFVSPILDTTVALTPTMVDIGVIGIDIL